MIFNFRNWVLQTFPFLEDDFDSLTDYELFCKMLEYVKEFAKDNEEFKKQLEEFENYFNNLDVQEEINNKLDEMAEDGTLENLIGQYIQLQTTYTYNTVNDMKSATNLIDGSFARTSGFYSYNDGGGSFYKIRNVTNEDIVDEKKIISLNNPLLIAELTNTKEVNIEQLGIGNIEENHLILKYAIENFDIININSDISLSDTIILSNISNKIINGNNHIISINHSYNKNLMLLNNSKNIIFNEVNLTNDIIRTGSNAPEQIFLLYGNENNYITFNNCKFYNPYHNGVAFIKSGYLLFNKCVFKDVYYSGLILLPDTHDVKVIDSIFDTAHTTYQNAYLFSTGSFDYDIESEYLVKNIILKNNKFLNNPQWEGIDFHGGENITIEGNYVYNCLYGIHCVYDNRPTVISKQVDNIKIINNIVINDLLSTGDGIILSGSSEKYGSNYIVENNIIEGYGYNNNTHGINFSYCKQGLISNNQIRKFKSRGIGVAYSYNINVINNNISEPLIDTSAGIYSNVAYLCNIKNNIVIGSNDHLLQRCITTSNNKGLVILKDNLCYNYSQFKYYSGTNNNTIIGEVSNTNNKRLGVIGVTSVDIYDVPKSYCTDTIVRGVAGASNLTVSGSANTNILTCNNTLLNICPYQEIIISGAGEGGADLTTQIMDVISQTEIKIKDNLLTSVENATVSTTASTWSNI